MIMIDGDGEILKDMFEFVKRTGTRGEPDVDNRVKWEFCLLIAMFVWI